MTPSEQMAINKKLMVQCRKVNCSPEDISTLVNLGAQVDSSDINGETPLHIASMGRNIELCSELVSRGAKVNVQDRNGSTPLHKAAALGSAQMCEFFVSKGANINAIDHEKLTPLMIAVSYGHFDTCLSLLRSDAGSDFIKKFISSEKSGKKNKGPSINPP